MTQDSNPQKVLVTGARGFVGRAVVKLLQRKGYEVVALDRSPVTAGCDYRQVTVDITDTAQLRDAFAQGGMAGIVHLAAILPTAAQRDPELATRVNVHGSVNLLEMAREFGVRRFVFGSSLSIYGTWPANYSVSEADRAAPEDVYGAAKLYVEQCGAAYRGLYGLEFVSLRIGRVVGPGARSKTSAWRSQIFESLSAREATVIEMPFRESERILAVHVDDVAGMLVKLIQAPQPWQSIYNACCESVVVGELKRTVEELNSNIQVRLGSTEVIGNPRALDCSRFRTEFGFETVPILEQLRAAAGGMPV